MKAVRLLSLAAAGALAAALAGCASSGDNDADSDIDSDKLTGQIACGLSNGEEATGRTDQGRRHLDGVRRHRLLVVLEGCQGVLRLA